ncbi:MAG: hypothetical protein ACTHNW_03670 [Mucilaginibacter sp.]
MSLAKFLKNLFAQFVESYQQYFSKTFGYALLWTLLCFAIGQVLAAYSNYDPGLTVNPLSVLTYFELNLSMNATYSFVDGFKILFIFFVAVFSLKLLKKVSFLTVFYLFLTLILCIGLDYVFFLLGGLIKAGVSPMRYSYFYLWLFSILALFRLFVPFILFALAIQLNIGKLRFNFITLCYLFLSVWLFYEVSFEAMRFLRDNVFALILSPFKTKVYSYVVESLLGLPIVASYFVGYYCAMVRPFAILRGED